MRPAEAAGLAARPFTGTAPGRQSSLAPGNNEVPAGAARADRAFAAVVRAGVRLARRAGRARGIIVWVWERRALRARRGHPP